MQELTQLGDLQGSIQLILSTDGKNSFASFAYEDPNAIYSNIINPDLDEKTAEIGVEAVIGFDGGERSSGADFGQYLNRSNQSLQAIHTFRIDG